MKMHFSCANIYSQCQCLHDSLQNMVAFFFFFFYISYNQAVKNIKWITSFKVVSTLISCLIYGSKGKFPTVLLLQVYAMKSGITSRSSSSTST